MKLLFEYLFGPQLEKETARYLETLAETNVAASRRQTDALLKSLKGRSEPQITIGRTPWGTPVIVPVSEIVRAHGVVTGTTGSGKTRVDRKSTRLNSSHLVISYAVFCLKKKKHNFKEPSYKCRQGHVLC